MSNARASTSLASGPFARAPDRRVASRASTAEMDDPSVSVLGVLIGTRFYHASDAAPRLPRLRCMVRARRVAFGSGLLWRVVAGWLHGEPGRRSARPQRDVRTAAADARR